MHRSTNRLIKDPTGDDQLLHNVHQLDQGSIDVSLKHLSIHQNNLAASSTDQGRTDLISSAHSKRHKSILPRSGGDCSPFIAPLNYLSTLLSVLLQQIVKVSLILYRILVSAITYIVDCNVQVLVI